MFGLGEQPGGDTPVPASWLAWGDGSGPVHVADLAPEVSHLPAFVLQQLRDLGIA